MGKDTHTLQRDNKKRRIAETSKGDGVEQRPTTRIVDIPEDLLELILLRVLTPICVVRAAATCKLWWRVITGDGFHHRFRSRHGHGCHLLLGYYSIHTEPLTRRINTEFVPSPPRQVMAMGLLRTRFSVDFLIRPGESSFTERVLTDSHGALLAFVRDNSYLIVCDPCTMQYRELLFPWERPPIYIGDEDSYYFYRCLGCFFLDAGDDDSSRSSPMSSFRVLCACLVQDDYGLITAQARVFSARDNRWLPPSFSAAVSRECQYMLDMTSLHDRLVGRARGSIFWAGGNHVLILSESTGEFSTFELPPATPCCGKDLLVVAGGGAGPVCIVRVVDRDTLEVLTASRAHGSWECTMERNASLDSLGKIVIKTDRRSWRFVDTTMASSMLGLGVVFSPSSTYTLVFSLDVDTMTLHPADKTTTTTLINTQRVCSRTSCRGLRQFGSCL